MPVITQEMLLSIQGSFMEDHSMGQAWTQPGPTLGWVEPFVAQDGSTQMISVSGPLSEMTGPAYRYAVDRAYPSASSLSQWDSQQLGLGTDGSNPGDAMARPCPVMIGNKLLVFRFNQIDEIPLGPDGSFAGPAMSHSKQAGYSLVSGQLAPDTVYVPEVLVDTDVGTPTAIWLYDVRNLQRFPCPVILSDLWAPGDLLDATVPPAHRTARVFPLKDSGDGWYRCIVVEPSGMVRSVLLEMQHDSAGQHACFKAVDATGLGTTQNGCIYVDETIPGQVEVIFMDLPGVRSFIGTYNTGSRNAISWQSGPTPLITGYRMPAYGAGATYKVVGAYHTDVAVLDLFLMVRAAGSPTCDIWVTTRCVSGWRQLVRIQSECSDCVAFRDPDSVKLMISRLWNPMSPDIDQRELLQYEVWHRNSSGNWLCNVAMLPKETVEPVAIPSYRVGLRFTMKGVAMPGESITIRASSQALATVNGKLAVIPEGTPMPVTTDMSGCVWIVLQLKTRLAFPDIQVQADRLPLPVNIKLGSVIGDFLRSANGATFTTPIRSGGTPLISDQSLADDAATMMQKILAAVPVLPAGPPFGNFVDSGLPWEWLSSPLSPPAITLATDAACLDHANGCRSMGQDDATNLIRQDLRNLLSPPPPSGGIPDHPLGRNFLSDVYDGIEDLGEWVGGRLSDAAQALGSAGARVIKVTLSGITVAIELMVQGVSYVYAGIVDTVHAALDAVRAIFDFAGVALAEGALWLMQKIGDPFDWEGLKDRRNQLRTLVRDNLGQIRQWLPSAATAAESVTTKLDSFHEKLQTYRSTAGSTQSISDRFPVTDAMMAMEGLGGLMLLPKSEWLNSKFAAAIQNLTTDCVTLNIPSLNTAADAAATVADDVMDYLAGSLASIRDAAQNLGQSTDSFMDYTLQAIADVVLGQIDNLIRLVRDLIAKAASAVDALIDNASAILTALDARLPIPFFGAFYKHLTGNDLSLFDVACLAASIHGGGSARLAGVGVSRVANDSATVTLNDAARWFMFVSVGTTTLDAFASSFVPGTYASKTTTALNVVALLGTFVCGLAADISLYRDVAISVGGAIAALLYGWFGAVFLIVGQALMVIVRLVLMIVDFASSNWLGIGYQAAALFQGFFAMLMNLFTNSWTRRPGSGMIPRFTYQRINVENPLHASVFAAVQGGLGFTQYAIVHVA